jgi:hypothetical protein
VNDDSTLSAANPYAASPALAAGRDAEMSLLRRRAGQLADGTDWSR